MSDESCLCRPCGFLLGLPFMLLSAFLSLVGLVLWLIATLLALCCPCGICIAGALGLAMLLIKMPISLAGWFTHKIPC